MTFLERDYTKKCFLASLFCCCSVTKSCLTLCDPMDGSTPGFLVFHHLPELPQKRKMTFWALELVPDITLLVHLSRVWSYPRHYRLNKTRTQTHLPRSISPFPTTPKPKAAATLTIFHLLQDLERRPAVWWARLPVWCDTCGPQSAPSSFPANCRSHRGLDQQVFNKLGCSAPSEP